MKVIAACTLIGKGDTLLTDQPFSAALSRKLSPKKTLRFVGDGRHIDLKLKSLQGAKKTDGEVLSFLVPEMDDATRAFIIGRDFEVL